MYVLTQMTHQLLFYILLKIINNIPNFYYITCVFEFYIKFSNF